MRRYLELLTVAVLAAVTATLVNQGVGAQQRMSRAQDLHVSGTMTIALNQIAGMPGTRLFGRDDGTCPPGSTEDTAWRGRYPVGTPLGVGSGATATATVSGGVVTGLNLTGGGSGYNDTVGVDVTIAGNATGTATVSGGVVTGLTLVFAGSGYGNTPPTVTITPARAYGRTSGPALASLEVRRGGSAAGYVAGSLSTINASFTRPSVSYNRPSVSYNRPSVSISYNRPSVSINYSRPTVSSGGSHTHSYSDRWRSDVGVEQGDTAAGGGSQEWNTTRTTASGGSHSHSLSGGSVSGSLSGGSVSGSLSGGSVSLSGGSVSLSGGSVDITGGNFTAGRYTDQDQPAPYKMAVLCVVSAAP